MSFKQHFSIAIIVVATAAAGQISPTPALTPESAALTNPDPPSLSPQPLFDFKDSDIKFNLRDLVAILRDPRHEGWVLAAYPDPKTKRPLIGAGFSLDLESRQHLQRDLLNPHPFAEPSSAQLWQAAGLEPERLQLILTRFQSDWKTSTTKKYFRRTRTRLLTPQVTDEEAMRLLRISAIQAVSNARAYCRDFDHLSGPQQMALSQLVFQMGVNLEEFTQFLGMINQEISTRIPLSGVTEDTDTDYWESMQHSLMQSQWARRYSARAISVIAMFDPDYSRNPVQAEHLVATALHPSSVRSLRGHSAPQLRRTTLSRNGSPGSRGNLHRARHRRKLA